MNILQPSFADVEWTRISVFSASGTSNARGRGFLRLRPVSLFQIEPARIGPRSQSLG